MTKRRSPDALLIRLLTLTAIAAAPGVARAQSDARPDDDTRAILERLERLERENQEMRGRLAEIDEDWLTETRAAELRSLVHDLVADADLRASGLQSGLLAGWDNGFFLTSPDNRFRMNINGLMQIRYVYSRTNPTDRNLSGFENTRTKLTFSGHVFSPDLTYMIRGNFSRRDGGIVLGDTDGALGDDRDSGGEFRLQDAWVRFALDEEWDLRIGQFKLPFNREELVQPQYQLAVERSLVNSPLNLGFSQGAELTYHNHQWRWQFAVSDGGNDQLGGVGSLLGTTPQNTRALRADVDYAFTTRLEFLAAGEWAQFRDLTSPVGDPYGLLFGLGVHVQKSELDGAPSFSANESSWWALSPDVSIEWGGANLFMAGFYHNADTFNLGTFEFWAGMIQGGVYVDPKIELFARTQYGIVEQPGVDFPDLWLGTFGMNYYMDGHDAKITADLGVSFSSIAFVWDTDLVGWRTDERRDEPQFLFRVQYQLMF